MPRKPKRPEPFRISGSDVRVRVADGPDADGRWYWRADRAAPAGKRDHVWVGWGTAMQAEIAVLQVLEAEKEPEPTGELVTVEDLLSAWTASVDDREDTSEHTRLACTGAAKRLLAHGLAIVRVDALGRAAIEAHRNAALRAGVAGSTVMRDLKYLRQAWAWARDCGEVPDRDLQRVRVERKARKPVYSRYTPTRGEIAQLLAGVSPAWVRRSLILLSTTGARIGEVAGLTWSQVAPDCSWVELDGKTGPRIFPLHPSVVVELKRWTRGGPSALVLGVSPKRANNVTRAELRRVSDELGIPRVSPNGLRRAMTDALYRGGVGVEVEAKLLGHSPETAMSLYRQVVDLDRAKAVTMAGVGMPVVGDVLPFPGTVLSDGLSELTETEEQPGEKYSQGD